MDRFHTSHLVEEKASRRIHVVREQIDQTAIIIKAWSFSARNLEKCVKKLKKRRRSKIGRQVKNQSSKMPEVLEVFISFEPGDEEFKEIIKSARRHSEVPAAPAMPCKKDEWQKVRDDP